VALSRDVLVLRALGVGDLLVAVPALRGLRRAVPDARMVLAAPSGLAELAGLTGAVDELLPTPGLGALRWPRPAPRLAVNLHGRGPQSIADLWSTHPDALISHAHKDFPDLDGPQWIEDTHEVERWCRLLVSQGIAADRSDLELSRPATPSPARGAVVVHPGAAFPSRRWPPSRYGRVARGLTAAGHRVVITGSGKEIALARRVASEAGLPPDAVLAGRTGLAELAALVADAGLVVCGDTGVGHLATAYGTPSVLLFGPVPPARWGPPADRPRHRVLWAGRVGDPFAGTPDPGLLRLTVHEVLAGARRALAEGRVTVG
jgi:ADP-heptose:LPS heptosyltransferase